MTNVSHRHIDTLDFKLSYKQLLISITTLKQADAHYFFDELFTEAERIMIVKRFAAIILFQKNYSSYRVSDTIGLSLSTAQRLFEQYQEGHYKNLLLSIPKAQKNELVSLLEDFMLSKVSSKARSRLIKKVFSSS